MRATEASRGFSDVLSRVAAGETIEVDRHGAVVAIIAPARRTLISGAALVDLIKRLPVPDPDFAHDVASLPALLKAPSDPWRS